MQKNKYQTLSEFLIKPFGNSGSMVNNEKYSDLYESYIKDNKIRIEGYTVIENSYYVHIKIPSETHKEGNYEYDVVIRFFTDDPTVESQQNLMKYYIQFFSNSPSFIYKYAVLYKKSGYLIEFLQSKLDSEYADTLPEVTNSGLELSYDKSIYFACRKLSEMKFRALNKSGILLQKKKSADRFMSAISDFNSVKLDQQLLQSEKQLKKQLETIKNRGVNKGEDVHRKLPSKSTSKTKAKTTTSKTGSVVIRGKKGTKKISTKSTKIR